MRQSVQLLPYFLYAGNLYAASIASPSPIIPLQIETIEPFADHPTSSVRQLNAHTPHFLQRAFQSGRRSNDWMVKSCRLRYSIRIGRAESRAIVYHRRNAN
jgi:hypothetical protein